MTMLVLLGRIGDQAVAIDATCVDTVATVANIVPVPFAPSHIVGIAAIRSETVTVVDARVATGGAALPPSGRAAICTVDGHRYALRLDAIDDVAPHAVEADALSDRDAWGQISKGRIDLGERFAILIDPAAIVDIREAVSS